MFEVKKEVWYVWKEYVIPEGETERRFITPWSDPMLYEYSFDFLFPTIDAALQGLDDWGVGPEERKEWVLCKEILEPVHPMFIIPLMKEKD